MLQYNNIKITLFNNIYEKRVTSYEFISVQKEIIP